MTVTELCNEKHAFQQTFFVHRTMLDSTIYVELLRGKKKQNKKKHVTCECWVFRCSRLKVTNMFLQ